MPTVTRTVAKGIPPRTHLPPKPKNDSRKRQASDSGDDESSEGSELDDARPKAKAKKHKRQRKATVESEEEVESVDDTTEPRRAEVEEVDDGPGSEVSTNPLVKWHRLTQL